MARGRRPGTTTTRDDVVRAARAEFAARGYDAVSVRDVARRAGVDPALPLHWFGSKDGLFAAAVELTLEPDALDAALAGPRSRLGERVTRFFLSVWDSPTTGPAIASMARSATGHDGARRALIGFVAEQVLGRVVHHVAPDRPRLRAALAGSQLVGVATTRYLLGLPEIADVRTDELVAAVAPSVQRYLTGPIAWPAADPGRPD